MSARPRLLDLCCGAGGASVGYHRAGFDVTGVDIVEQPHYPFRFVHGDALEIPLDGYEAIHASPPCQLYSVAAVALRNRGAVYPELIAPVRERLRASGVPWVIENVPGSPIRPDLVLCGCQVGLALRRVRWFETSWHAFTMMHPHHHPDAVVSVVGRGTPSWVKAQLGRNPTIGDYREAMGIQWMNRIELSQAIPPAYTEHIGRELMSHILEPA